MEEKVILNCPRCGRVEGYAPLSNGDVDEPPDSDSMVEEEVVRTPAGPAVRVRCPQCGRWISPDRVSPA